MGYSHRLKFTFFSKTDEVDDICKIHGILTNNEIMILESPDVWSLQSESYVPPPPRYRMDDITTDRVAQFFQLYESGDWPRYYRSALGTPTLATFSSEGIRELVGSDFATVVDDPRASVLVLFVDSNCSTRPGCKSGNTVFEKAALEVTRR